MNQGCLIYLKCVFHCTVAVHLYHICTAVKSDVDAQRCPNFKIAQHPAAPPAQELSVIHSTVEACKQGAPPRNKIHAFLTKYNNRKRQILWDATL